MQLSPFCLTGFQFIVGAFTLFRVTFGLSVAPNLNYSVFFFNSYCVLNIAGMPGLSTPTVRKKLHFKTHFLFKEARRGCLKNTSGRFIETWFENKSLQGINMSWACATFRHRGNNIQTNNTGVSWGPGSIGVLVWCRQSHLECIKSKVG